MQASMENPVSIEKAYTLKFLKANAFCGPGL